MIRNLDMKKLLIACAVGLLSAQASIASQSMTVTIDVGALSEKLEKGQTLSPQEIKELEIVCGPLERAGVVSKEIMTKVRKAAHKHPDMDVAMACF
jgi:hypothetical protein